MRESLQETIVGFRMPSESAPGETEAALIREGLEGQVACPFCGVVGDGSHIICPKCTMENSAVARKATKLRIGPWYVLQNRNPAAPGMKWETLLAFVRKGRVKPQSIVRGPTTHQLWRFAAHVKGLSREFGVCYSCGGAVERQAKLCPHCNRLQEAPADPDTLLESVDGESRLPVYKEISPGEVQKNAAPGISKAELEAEQKRRQEAEALLRQQREALERDRQGLAEQKEAAEREFERVHREDEEIARERESLKWEKELLEKDRGTLAREREAIRRDREAAASAARDAAAAREGALREAAALRQSAVLEASSTRETAVAREVMAVREAAAAREAELAREIAAAKEAASAREAAALRELAVMREAAAQRTASDFSPAMTFDPDFSPSAARAAAMDNTAARDAAAPDPARETAKSGASSRMPPASVAGTNSSAANIPPRGKARDAFLSPKDLAAAFKLNLSPAGDYDIAARHSEAIPEPAPVAPNLFSFDNLPRPPESSGRKWLIVAIVILFVGGVAFALLPDARQKVMGLFGGTSSQKSPFPAKAPTKDDLPEYPAPDHSLDNIPLPASPPATRPSTTPPIAPTTNPASQADGPAANLGPSPETIGKAKFLYSQAKDAEKRSDYAAAVKALEELETLPKAAWPGDAGQVDFELGMYRKLQNEK